MGQANDSTHWSYLLPAWVKDLFDESVSDVAMFGLASLILQIGLCPREIHCCATELGHLSNDLCMSIRLPYAMRMLWLHG